MSEIKRCLISFTKVAHLLRFIKGIRRYLECTESLIRYNESNVSAFIIKRLSEHYKTVIDILDFLISIRLYYTAIITCIIFTVDST